jgi:cytochrome c peroxidase
METATGGQGSVEVAKPCKPSVRSIYRGAVLGLMVTVLMAGCQRASTVTRIETLPGTDTKQLSEGGSAQKLQDDLSPRLLRRFAAIHTPAAPENPALVRLGRMLFYEPLLSRSGTISCNSCHPLDRYGTTATKLSVGVGGKLGRRNAPTVYNSAGHFRQFWDGRVGTLDEQAAGPIGNPDEMGMKPGAAVEVLRAVAGYRAAFAQAYPDQAEPITIEHVTAAIAEFERGLVTPARWDRYIDGDTQALTPTEKEGAKLFANLGCMVCHTGAYLGGTMFEKLGIFAPWPNQTDHGRQEVTHNPADDMVFKVPSLRNVANTAPYFHDGSAASLDTAVRMMAHHQLGVDLTEDEARLIAAWLGSLSGEIPREYIAPPTLPPATRQ